jgi:hypothetical protein
LNKTNSHENKHEWDQVIQNISCHINDTCYQILHPKPRAKVGYKKITTQKLKCSITVLVLLVIFSSETYYQEDNGIQVIVRSGGYGHKKSIHIKHETKTTSCLIIQNPHKPGKV